jgi:hypothetical protein
MRDQDLLSRELDTLAQPVPSGIERVEGDSLHATAHRPIPYQTSRQ